MNWPNFNRRRSKPKGLAESQQRIRELESEVRLKDLEIELLAQIVERDRERWAAETAIAAKARVLAEVEVKK